MKDEVVIVIGTRAVRVSPSLVRLYSQCAGQMIDDGHHRDYYKGRQSASVMRELEKLHNLLCACETPEKDHGA